MSNPESAELRFVARRELLTLSEKAFRAAAREIVLIRPSRSCVTATLLERLRLHLERLAGSGSISSLDSDDVRRIEHRVQRFVASALFRRLMALPPARLILADGATFDLIVRGGDQGDIAVRFAMASTYVCGHVDVHAVFDSDIATVLTYDPSSGRTKRIDRELLGGQPIRQKIVERAGGRSTLSAAA